MTAQTVLITGCSTGFGKLAAKDFQSRGWNVIATMRTPERETELANSDTMLVSQLDVTSEASIAKAIQEGIAKFESIDVLVNNAGYGARAMFEQSDDTVIRNMYETNVFGLMKASQAILPHMRERGSGRIINVTSMAGMIGVPGNSIYSSTKFAVEGLTQALAHEYAAFGIQVKSVAPGAFSTTDFGANAKSYLEAGDPQLQGHAKKLHEHFQNVALAGAPQDPQLVSDIIMRCATDDMPVHNPVGADAEGLAQVMQAVDDKQTFVEMMAQRLLPQE